MGILDGIVDWLATQVMNLLDLASTSVLGALGCNMDTFRRYFPAASAMYEIFIWTAIGLVLLNLVWQLYRCYGAGFDIDTENAERPRSRQHHALQSRLGCCPVSGCGQQR